MRFLKGHVSIFMGTFYLTVCDYMTVSRTQTGRRRNRKTQKQKDTETKNMLINCKINAIMSVNF